MENNEIKIAVLEKQMDNLEDKVCGLEEVYSKFTGAIERFAAVQEAAQKTQERNEANQKELGNKVVELAKIVAVMQERQEQSLKEDKALRADVNQLKECLNNDSKKNSLDVRDIVKNVITFIIMAVVSAVVALVVTNGGGK